MGKRKLNSHTSFVHSDVSFVLIKNIERAVELLGIFVDILWNSIQDKISNLSYYTIVFIKVNIQKGTSRQRSGKGAIRKKNRFPEHTTKCTAETLCQLLHRDGVKRVGITI